MLQFSVQQGKWLFGVTVVIILSLIMIYQNAELGWTNKSFPMAINLHTKFQTYLLSKKSSSANNSQHQNYNIVATVFNEEYYVNKASEIVRNLPAVPYVLGTEIQNRERTCANYPTVYEIEYSNILWQVQRQQNWTAYLFGAYWDIRKLNTNAPSIRILGMMDVTDEDVPPNYCQIWFKNQSDPLIVNVTDYNYLFQKYWGNYRNGELLGYIFNCPLPGNYTGTVPLSVSLVSFPCENATNNLRVYFDEPRPEEKQVIGVCLKWLEFGMSDWSMRLIEWIEMLLILGVHKIYMYKVSVHPNMQKVLNYYEGLGKIEVSPLTLPAGLPNEPNLRRAYFDKIFYRQLQHELIPLNDCLYRNLYKYNFISLLDIDEIVIPHNGANTWIELINKLEKKKKKSTTPYYVFSNVGFTTEDRPSLEKENANIPEYLYMLRHTIRWTEKAPNGGGIKAFHRPEEVLTIHNHFPSSCIGKCELLEVNMTDGFLHHYRTSGSEWTNLNESLATMDNYIWKWKDELIKRTSKALLEMDIRF